MSHWVQISLGLIAMLAVAPDQAAGQDASRESELKAAYMYNFSRYIEWPEDAFASATAPFVIGIVGVSAVEPHLATVAATKTIRNRAIRSVRITQAEQAAGCHMVLIGTQADPKLQNDVLAAMAGKPILLVSEGPFSAVAHGGQHFVIQQNRLRVQTNSEQVRKRGLKISSKLLQVVEDVR